MMLNKPLKWFSIWLLAMILLIIFTQPESRPDKLDTMSFATTESAELYFKNIRSFYYNKREEGGSVLEVYRLKSVFDDTAKYILPFALYNNWRANLAFLRLDTTRIDRNAVLAVMVGKENEMLPTCPCLVNTMKISLLFPETFLKP